MNFTQIDNIKQHLWINLFSKSHSNFIIAAEWTQIQKNYTLKSLLPRD